MNGPLSSLLYRMSWCVATTFLLSTLAAAQFHERTEPDEIGGIDLWNELEAWPRAAGDGAGNWVAVWMATLAAPGNYFHGMVVSRSADNGATWTQRTTVDPTPTTMMNDNSPEIVTDGAGTWIVVWSRNIFAGTQRSLVVSRSTDNGASWTLPHTLGITDASVQERAASIATDRAGHWIIVWDTDNLISGDIQFARSADNGVTWSSAIPLTPAADSIGDSAPAVATDEAGRWMIVWTTENGGFDLVFVTSTDNGATWSSTAPVVAAPDAITTLDATADIAFGSGHWVIVWLLADEVLNIDADIFVMRSANDGLTWSTPTLVNPAAANDSLIVVDTHPRLTTDRAGNWMIGWRQVDDLSTEINDRNFIARSSDNGTTWTTPIRLLPGDIHNEWAIVGPCVETDRAGHWLLLWEVSQVDGQDEDILFSRWTGILAPDRDGDNLSDADETIYGSNPNSYDTDGDTLDDADEVSVHNTQPALSDTDGDGVRDDIELALGTDPNDALDFPSLPLYWMWMVATLAAIGIVTLVARVRRASGPART